MNPVNKLVHDLFSPEKKVEACMPVGWKTPSRALKKVDGLITDLNGEMEKLLTRAGQISLNQIVGNLDKVKADYNLVKEKLALLQTVRIAILADDNDSW